MAARLSTAKERKLNKTMKDGSRPISCYQLNDLPKNGLLAGRLLKSHLPHIRIANFLNTFPNALQLLTSNHRTNTSKLDGESLHVSKILYYLKGK